MKIRLNQAIALSKDAKAKGEGALTTAYHAVQKTTALSGLSKTYRPDTEDGQQLPGDSTKLQLRVPEILAGAVAAASRQLDLVATVDRGNQLANSNVIVDGEALLVAVPVATLLSLEKFLATVAAVVSKLQILDPAEEWEDQHDGSHRTKVSSKSRTDKVPTKFEKAPATDKHPAQVDILYLDQVVGFWDTIKFSGAVTEKRQRELAAKVAKLQAAVKIAREAANMTEVDDVKIGEQIFKYLEWSAE